MLTELIIFGGIAFWVLVAVLFLALLIATETESPGWATSLLLIFIAVNVAFGNVGTFVVQSPMKVLYVVLGYALAGILWTFPAWILFLRKVRKSYLETRSSFALEKDFQVSPRGNFEGIPAEHRDAFYRKVVYVEPRDSGLDYDTKKDSLDLPTFSKNDWRFYLWAIAWPVSVVNTVIGDFLVNVLKSLHKIYDHISSSIFKG